MCCGIKGVPSDKNNRLAILSMREERLSGRIRWFIHLPTHNMIMDGLTKPGLFPCLMHLATTGNWQINYKRDKGFTMRRVDRTSLEYSEDDLVRLDQ